MGAARAHVESGVALYNVGELEQLAERYADNAVEINPRGSFTGRQAILERLRRESTAFADPRITPVRWTEAGETVILNTSGPQRTPGRCRCRTVPSCRPPGGGLTLAAVSVFCVVDGTTTQNRTYYDQLPLLTQLGLLTP